MRETVIRAWCDACWQDGEQRTPSTHSYTAGIVVGETRPGLKLLELCDMHDKLALDLMALLADIGTVPEFKVKSKAPEPVVQYAMSKTVSCPVCNTGLTRSSLVNHIWSNHRTDNKPNVGTVCPECRTEYDTGQGVAAHRRFEHGHDAVAEALAGVKGYKAPK